MRHALIVSGKFSSTFSYLFDHALEQFIAFKRLFDPWHALVLVRFESVINVLLLAPVRETDNVICEWDSVLDRIDCSRSSRGVYLNSLKGIERYCVSFTSKQVHINIRLEKSDSSSAPTNLVACCAKKRNRKSTCEAVSSMRVIKANTAMTTFWEVEIALPFPSSTTRPWYHVLNNFSSSTTFFILVVVYLRKSFMVGSPGPPVIMGKSMTSRAMLSAWE